MPFTHRVVSTSSCADLGFLRAEPATDLRRSELCWSGLFRAGPSAPRRAAAGSGPRRDQVAVGRAFPHACARARVDVYSAIRSLELNRVALGAVVISGSTIPVINGSGALTVGPIGMMLEAARSPQAP
jgi:hypothetical protein